MSRSFLHDKRGVSEIIASLMMVLIVSVAGVALYSYSLSAFSTSSSSYQQQTDQREERTQERFSIIAVWWDNSIESACLNITVLNYGKVDLAVDAVYLNRTVVTTFLSGNGTMITRSNILPVKFTSPVSILDGQTYEITAVSERGTRDVVYWKA